MRFYIVYPEERWVSEEKIRQWYEDAVANNEVEDCYEKQSTDPVVQAQVLDCIGHITLDWRTTQRLMYE